ncbi:MAG: hypothetical protein A2509_01760 [Candidatus Edwardsbacteria bacterium RIFOXYD12_FULL_50_11]|uniref:Uncharacterized protein n=1 Tax=Candidatus Edwardsbacteria bacterium GWF2_54_11 TaxID=1817851 RepID=A0A1F5RCS1_9BACT|nr:MAG: hypothetical protein A2502_03085 [Candidatus Edwardsbacteria bacterium RifOxyC12_full_54_24]OGF07700.1 MAG: hypothetical protein A2273_04335 [Candidatus Edwardsbacteria bacterium RifOxyA12_full_54_48]OGF09951.1 MAG: hypothetical protein A3K15_10745 [Candidatus Edwardsbacteria bacterium GWE2_54_12]OGF12212.1 MAG: hypothetical protein A2024_04300 [Candidatus Edwardsbacteria bacterium GWF2_54_11]OGF16312.1 MAG: hypothetical protein A2509_01760 [Candidatus Edwardsbacteria bacterium RIFOXYD1
MKILLVAPTALDRNGKPVRQRWLHLPCLTLPLLAALTPPEHEVRLVFETIEDIPYDEKWDLVGLTGMGSGIVRAWQIADEFRKRGGRVIIGGIAASLGQKELTLAHADSLVIGEADAAWPRIVDDAAQNALLPVYVNEAPPDLNDLPVPRYDLFKGRHIGTWMPVQATRGCPFSCTFCSVSAFYSGKYRKRPVEMVIRDVRAATCTGRRRIAFIDDNIGADPVYFEELCTALAGENIIWMSQCSLTIADHPRLLALARKSGCRILSFGVESVNAESLKEIGKERNHPDRYANAIDLIRKNGIDVSTEMIIGFDGDDETVFERTYDFIMKNRISVPRIHILTPVPGTEIRSRLKSEGRITSDDFSCYSGGQVVFQPRAFSAARLQAEYWRLYQRLFSLPAIFHRTVHNNASLDIFTRIFVIGTNLHYRRHIKKRICPGIV